VDVNATWISNADHIRLACVAEVGNRTVGRASASDAYASVGTRSSTSCDMRIRKRFHTHVRMRLLVTVMAGSDSGSATRTVRY
jgi:hypothetical protein